MTTKEQKGVDVKDRVEEKYKRPRMYSVIFMNDDFTPFAFVTEILQSIFKKSKDEANNVAAEIHKNGTGIAGIYTSEIAETKMVHAMFLAKEEGHPLQVTMEPE